jgi:hypothetical protein
MRIQKTTPVLVVDAIEPCLPFWVERLGYERGPEVPDGDRLGFVLLSRDGQEVMLQTTRSVQGDLPQVLEGGPPRAFLFVEVDDLDAIERAFRGVPPAVARRQTFYGMDEIGFRDPAGNVVLFARRTG